LHATSAGVLPAAARQAPGSTGLDSAIDGNWIQECTDRSLDQGCRQDNIKVLFRNQTQTKKSKTLVIHQL